MRGAQLRGRERSVTTVQSGTRGDMPHGEQGWEECAPNELHFAQRRWATSAAVALVMYRAASAAVTW